MHKDLMAEKINNALVKILLKGKETPAGMGLLIYKDYIITCAHVVEIALGKPHIDNSNEIFTIVFPLIEGKPRIDGYVEKSIPEEDIAFLKIKDSLPETAIPLMPAIPDKYTGKAFYAFGYPEDVAGGNNIGRSIKGQY
jgi:hypothetical protein